MAARLIARSKSPALGRLLLPRPLSSSSSSAAPHPIGPPAAADPRSAPCPSWGSAHGLPPLTPMGWGCEQTSHFYSLKSFNVGTQALSRCFCVKAQGETATNQLNIDPQRAPTKLDPMEKSGLLNVKKAENSKIMAFSPLEGTLARERKGVLGGESLKIKRIEQSLIYSYYLIPTLLLISKSNLTTSIIVLATFWQVHGFFKEIFLDYVHHQVTLKWVLVYFSLLLLILTKDTILLFNLV